jgi:two-component system sensor histidine kinase UhpB
VRGLTLRQRIFLTNAVVIAIAAAVLVLTPATVSSPAHLREVVVVVTGLSIILLINLVLLRQALTPLERLTTLMRRVEPLRPGRRIPVYGQEVEIVELTRAFNEMLDRLEAERQDSVSRSIRAQESERLRVARELHDEVGQSLTAVVLQIDRLARMTAGDVQAELAEAREQARSSLEDVRDIARRLRPEALDDLGLANALASLAGRLSESSGVPIEGNIEGALPQLSPEAEVVFYRVAQEGVTNALRHAEPTRISLGLLADQDTGELSLTIEDDGRGMNGAQPGAGIQGMRERALLLGAQLEIESDSAGTTVTLRAIPK